MKVASRQAGRGRRQAADGTVTGQRRDCYQRHATCGRGRCALLGLQMCVQSVADDTATTLSDPPAGVRERETEGERGREGGEVERRAYVACLWANEINAGNFCF